MSTISMKYVVLFTVFISLKLVNGDGCQLANSDANAEALLGRLDDLKGQSFHVKNHDFSHLHEYDVTICGPTNSGTDAKDGAVEIVNKGEGNKEKRISLGKFTESLVTGGENWIYLTYKGGQIYDPNICNNSSRTASIIIVCNPKLTSDSMEVLEYSNNTKAGKCSYLFSLETARICKQETKQHSLSSGSVFCIIFITFAAAYLLFGFLYQRFVVGAKGYEQFPNLSFWQQFGELQADGCDFVCRWRSRSKHSEYKGIDSDLRNSTSVMDDDDSSDRDDHLLPV